VVQGEILYGGVGDRPWGQTLGALWLGELTGHLTVRIGDDELEVVFERGNVVAAVSPYARDSVPAIGVAAGLVPRAEVDGLRRLLAAQLWRDPIEVVAESLGMPAYIALRLRRSVLVQRAARTFALGSGQFIVADLPHSDTATSCMVDTRAVVYAGALRVLDKRALIDQLAALGTRFQLEDHALLDSAQFGFTEPLPPETVGLADLVDHTKRAMMYALVCCGVYAATTSRVSKRAATPLPTIPRTKTLRDIVS